HRPAIGAEIGHVRHHRAQHRHEVDAGVFVEILVFGGEKGVYHAPRNRLDRHEDALLGGVLGDQTAVTSVHAGDRRWFVVGELAVFWQAAAVMVEEVEHATGAGNYQDHRQAD